MAPRIASEHGHSYHQFMQNIILILGSVILVSLISLIGVVLFSLQEKIIRKCLLCFVSFSTGALLGDVFLHKLPEMFEHSELATDHSVHLSNDLMIVLAGIIISFIIEKIIHWRHCHNLDCDGHVHPVGPLMLIGDSVHNLVDGMLIAGSFLVSIPLGIATTTAVALHEIPQEIGDFEILLHSGYSRGKSVFFNFLSAVTAIIGALAIIISSGALPDIGHILIPLTAGNFLYIAGSDLIPELHKETKLNRAVIQLVMMVAGIGLMYLLVGMDVH